MITTGGKLHIKRYLAGYVPSIARSIAVGIGPAAESLADEKLQLEVERVNIVYTGYDFVNNKLIFKATLPPGFAGTIYETGLYSTSVNELAGEYGSKLLTTFDSNTENWVNPTTGLDSAFVTANIRVGTDGLRQSPTATNTQTDALQNVFFDLSGHSASDRFVMAYLVGNAFVSALSVRFLTDASNYYQLSLPTPTAGYKITEMTKATATVTGTPDWANINEIRLICTSTAGGAGIIDWDAIRIEDVDTINPDYQLVAREVLSTPFTTLDGRTQEVEFALDVTV